MNKLYIFLLLLLVFTGRSVAQDNNVQSSDLKEFYTFIKKNIKYPVSALRMGVEGAVYTQFTTDESGHVVSMELLKGFNESCNAEAKRVILLSPAEHLKSLVDKTQQNKFVLPIFYGLDKPLKKEKQLAPTTDAYMLPPVDILAGGITVTRRELGTGVTTVSRGSVPRPEPEIITYTDLSDALAESKSVRKLSLRNNNLTSFPADILKLKNLSFLDLEQNQLQTLPREIEQLTDLKELFLLENKLTSLPDNFGNIKKLKTLGLASNQLDSFPLQLIAMEKLETLDLSNNQLSVIPSEIGLMKNLKVLVLVYNKIKSIPPEIYELKKLERIYLQGNPINQEDIDLLKRTFKKAEIGF